MMFEFYCVKVVGAGGGDFIYNYMGLHYFVFKGEPMKNFVYISKK